MSLKILVVDDDPEIRMIYRHTLEREQYLVFEAGDGNEAINQFNTIAPDVIVLDMMMPNMNGEEVLKAIREVPSGQAVAFIVITAYPKSREFALLYSVDHFLTKPVRPQEILQAISSIKDQK